MQTSANVFARQERKGTKRTMTEADAKQTCDKIRQMAYVLNLDHGLLINFGSSKFQCRHLYRRK